MRLANKARGEALIHINGEARIICLTLGAIAQLEALWQVAGAAGLSARLRHIGGGDMAQLIAVLLADDGPKMDVAALLAARIDPFEAASALAQVFSPPDDVLDAASHAKPEPAPSHD